MKIIYVDMDDVLVDFQTGIDQCSKQTLAEFKERYDEIPGIFGKMKPMKDAIKSYNELSKKFDTYILSTSPWENDTALVDKLNWVKNYLGKVAYKRVIFSHHKNLNCGDYLIDDRDKNGVKEFKGEHLHFGAGKRFPDWNSIIEYLNDKA